MNYLPNWLKNNQHMAGFCISCILIIYNQGPLPENEIALPEE